MVNAINNSSNEAVISVTIVVTCHFFPDLAAARLPAAAAAAVAVQLCADTYHSLAVSSLPPTGPQPPRGLDCRFLQCQLLDTPRRLPARGAGHGQGVEGGREEGVVFKSRPPSLTFYPESYSTPAEQPKHRLHAERQHPALTNSTRRLTTACVRRIFLHCCPNGWI